MSEINPTSFFDLSAASASIDATIQPSKKQEDENVFATLEQTLQLPIGSTKEALAASKDAIARTKSLAMQAEMVTFKEQSIDTRDAEDIDDEVLKADRAKIRKSMCAAVTKSLADLNKMTKEFREENDRYIEKKIQSGELDVTEQEFDFSPEQANKIIAHWTKENEADIQEKVRQEVEERELARIGVETKQIENKEEQ